MLRLRVLKSRDLNGNQMQEGPEYYDHTPDITQSYSYIPIFRSLFAIQSEFGRPVKVGKTYPNAFFSNLASVNYFYTYVPSFLSFGLTAGKGRQLNTAQKSQYKIVANRNGECFFKDRPDEKITSGFYRYIVSPKGGLYIFPLHDLSLYHNSIRGSQPVQCAGVLKLDNRFITWIDNSSGHYRPTRGQFMRTLGGLFSAKFIDEGTEVFTFKSDSHFNYIRVNEGDVDDLMKQGDIQIPKPWQATRSVHAKMKKLTWL